MVDIQLYNADCLDKMDNIRLIQGDCLDVMKIIPNNSIDMVLCDLPYEVLNKDNKYAQWDKIIPFDRLWEQYERIIKDNGAIVLFGQGMFSAKLMLSNEKLWRYNLIWGKGGRCSGFLNAKRMPLRAHEDILVFYKHLPTYNPQMIKCEPHQRNHSRGKQEHKQTNRCYGEFGKAEDFISDYKYPKSILNFQRPHPQVHPTQKPVQLLAYLIKTYTNEGELVLDNCMGSGSTMVACIETNRGGIGIELDNGYFKIAQNRVNEVMSNKNKELQKKFSELF